MKEKNTAQGGNLEIVEKKAPYTDGMNRQQRRDHEKAKLSANGFRAALNTMVDHLENIKGKLDAAVADENSPAEAIDLAPAYKELDAQINKIKPYTMGSLSRLGRAKLLPELQKGFDAFIADICTANV